MSWFEQLTGFSETTADGVRSRLDIDGEYMTSRVNGRRMRHGRLEVATLGALKARAAEVPGCGQLQINEVIADVGYLHRDPQNKGALFQAASQFNLLEMADPSLTPEDGVGIYDRDRTQGPACAIACGAGTIFRSYFAEVNGQQGQSADRQIDCLAGLAASIGEHWALQNGYAFANSTGLQSIRERIDQAGTLGRGRLLESLSIGLQWDTEVTTAAEAMHVSQAYCSAVPVGYSALPMEEWEPFARLVLDATYEATLAAGVLNAKATGNRSVFLTLVGGGVFANDPVWIADAILRAAVSFRQHGLDCRIVSYDGPSAVAQDVMSRFASLAD